MYFPCIFLLLDLVYFPDIALYFIYLFIFICYK